jgi:peroxiredoxin
MKRIYILPVSLFILSGITGFSQPYTFRILLKNQPDHPVILGSIRGDRFTPLDTVTTKWITDRSGSNTGEGEDSSHPAKTARFTFPLNAVPGMYRLILGQTTYARVMGAPPQQVDFIFNQENIALETDFRFPEDSLKVITSEENLVWFGFLHQEKVYRNQLNILEKEVDYYQAGWKELKSSSAPDNSDNRLATQRQAGQKANEFNQLQMERDRMILQLADRNENLLASRLIRVFREPFRDGYLSRQERNESFQKEYFRYIDFSDESLIHSPVLTDKVFSYLVTYNQRIFTHEQREKAYIQAVDAVMQNVEHANPDSTGGQEMAEFILNYLVNGFEKLNMGNVLIYMADHYLGKFCQTADEKTTMERKLEAQKMRIGTEVPDFTLNDPDGHPVTLSKETKVINLIIFWASWCPHCNEMLPLIKTWYSQIPENELQVFAISLDHSKANWQKAVELARMEEFYNLSDLMEWDGEVTESYNVYATPTMFLIDRNRKILAKPLTVMELKEFVKR